MYIVITLGSFTTNQVFWNGSSTRLSLSQKIVFQGIVVKALDEFGQVRENNTLVATCHALISREECDDKGQKYSPPPPKKGRLAHPAIVGTRHSTRSIPGSRGTRAEGGVATSSRTLVELSVAMIVT